MSWHPKPAMQPGCLPGLGAFTLLPGSDGIFRPDAPYGGAGGLTLYRHNSVAADRRTEHGFCLYSPVAGAAAIQLGVKAAWNGGGNFVCGITFRVLQDPGVAQRLLGYAVPSNPYGLEIQVETSPLRLRVKYADGGWAPQSQQLLPLEVGALVTVFAVQASTGAISVYVDGVHRSTGATGGTSVAHIYNSYPTVSRAKDVEIYEAYFAYTAYRPFPMGVTRGRRSLLATQGGGPPTLTWKAPTVTSTTAQMRVDYTY